MVPIDRVNIDFSPLLIFNSKLINLDIVLRNDFEHLIDSFLFFIAIYIFESRV